MATEAREPTTTVLGMNGDNFKIYSPGLANNGKRRTGETERAMRKTMRCTKEGINWLVRKIEREGRDNLIRANEWEERRFQRRVELGRERVKLLLKGA